jgi:hypothetical protein
MKRFMPQPGQRAVTLPAEVVELAEDYYRKNERALRMERIRSYTALIQQAVIDYVARRERQDEAKKGVEAREHLAEFFRKNPGLLTKMGFESLGDFLSAAISETSMSEARQKTERTKR